MGKPTGFKESPRIDPEELPPSERVQHFREFLVQLPSEKLHEQAGRCMDCGVPFCHSACPLGNNIPDWNDLVFREDWKRAARALHATNNFPEFTGRLCPAPCEEACVLAITEPAVTIKNIESAIADRAFFEEWVEAKKPAVRSGKRVAVVGSGPAGLACAQQLNQAGHLVTVFERTDRVGGLLRYGIPDFKLERWMLDRRVKLLEDEGVIFRCGVDVGQDVSAEELLGDFQAVVLCVGATQPRDLPIPGRNLKGVHFAMDFLAQQNARNSDNASWKLPEHWWFSQDRGDILAQDKHVIVIGGGDSGADCVGVANRQRARSVTQFEWKDMPSSERTSDQPWPFWPMRLRTSSSHEEGCDRQWGVHTLEFVGERGRVSGLHTAGASWDFSGPERKLELVPGTETFWPAELVLIAAGFSGVGQTPMLEAFGVELDSKGNIATDAQFRTSNRKVFACGDANRGQSLVVWAISEGREAARAVDIELSGYSALPTKGSGDLLAA